MPQIGTTATGLRDGNVMMSSLSSFERSRSACLIKDMSETAGPDTRAVKYVEDLDFLPFHAIRDDVGVLDQDQLASARRSARATSLRVLH